MEYFKSYSLVSLVSLASFIFCIYFSVPFLIQEILFLHFDLGTHLLAGEIFLKSGTVPIQELWSSTAQGHDWKNMNWLWQIAAASLVNLTGDFRGLFVSIATQYGLIGVVLALHFIARGASIFSTLVFSVLFCLTWIFCSSLDPSLTISPKTSTYLFIPLLHLALYLTRESDKNFNLLLIALPVLVVFWGSIHGGAFPAIPLCGVYILDCLAKKDFANAIKLGFSLTIGFVLLVASSPLGINLAHVVFFSLADPDPSVLYNSGTQNVSYSNISIKIYLAVFALVYLFSIFRVSIGEHLLVLFFLYSGLNSSRHFAIFMLVSFPILAVGLQAWFTKSLEAIRNFNLILNNIASSKNFAVAGCLAATILVSTSLLWLPNNLYFPKRFYPIQAAEFVWPDYKDMSIWNDWNYGGFLNYHFGGEFPVWIDGRGATAYPTQILADYAFSYYQPIHFLNKYKIDLVFCRKQLPIVKFLRGNSDWQEIYSDSQAVVFTKK